MQEVTNTETSRCSTCKEVKPIDEFYTNKSLASGRQIRCKDCMKKLTKAMYQKRSSLAPRVKELEEQLRVASARAEALQKILNDLFHKSTF